MLGVASSSFVPFQNVKEAPQCMSIKCSAVKDRQLITTMQAVQSRSLDNENGVASTVKSHTEVPSLTALETSYQPALSSAPEQHLLGDGALTRRPSIQLFLLPTFTTDDVARLCHF